MDAAIKEGFYVDPDTNKVFFVMIRHGRVISPFWVKSKPADWKLIKRGGNKNG